MKTFSIFIVLAIIFGLTSCNKDNNPLVMPIAKSSTINDLHAPQEGGMDMPISGPFTKFSFAEGGITLNESKWDIAFRGTTIIINGGSATGLTDAPERIGNAAVYIATGTFANVTHVDPVKFVQDTNETGLAIPTGNGNGWYTYNPEAFTIHPTAGRILVFRTHDGKYAKIEILSYYEGAPTIPDALLDKSRYYTFNFVYQPKEGVTSFEK